MSRAASHGTWEDVFGGRPEDVVAVAEALRAVVRSADPDTVEVARPGEPSVCFGLGERKMSEAYLYLMPQADRVNLGFFRGADLPDPEGRLEGSGKALRHVKVRTVADARGPAIAALVRASIDERRRAREIS